MSDRPTPPGVVAGALEALRFNPLVIGVLLLNVLYVVAAAWYLTKIETQRGETIKLVLERCVAKPDR